MENNDLTVNDLLQIQKIIDVAVQRGAFKADESRIVGETYEKIGAFLQAFTTDGDMSSSGETTEEDSQND